MSEPRISPHVERAPYVTPDVAFPSDNEYGVPCLRLDYCADFVDLPIEPWGRRRRGSKTSGTIHFYTDDYRFSGLYADIETRNNQLALGAAQYQVVPYEVQKNSTPGASGVVPVGRYNGPGYALSDGQGDNGTQGEFKVNGHSEDNKKPYSPGPKGLWSDVKDNYHSGVSIWNNGDKVVQTGCVSVIEPNYTLSLFSPVAYVIWTMYKKRWLARFWQEWGIRTWVDLNVPLEFERYVLLGVPQGWMAYATRGYAERMEALELEWALARRHSGSDSPLFLVIGGASIVKQWCLERGYLNVIWMPEESDIRRGRVATDDYMRHSSFISNRQRLARPQIVSNRV